MVGSNSLANCGNIFIAGGYRGDVFGDRLDLSGSVTIGAGAALSMSADGTSTTAPFRSSLHGMDGTNTVACPITLTTGGVVNTNSTACLVSDAMLALTGPITGPGFIGKLIMRGAGNGIVAGPVTLGNAHFSKTDGGTWVLAAPGGFWTNTDIAGGTLAMGAAGALPTSLNINFTGGSLDLAGYSQQIATMGGTSGPIGSSSTNADCTFTLNTAFANTYGGAFQDRVSTGTRKLGVTVAGSGGLTLSGGNNRLPTNGLVTVSGTLNLLGSSQTNIGGLSLQGGTVASGAFLRSGVDYDAQAGTVNSSLGGIAGLTKSGAGTVTLAEACPYTGNTTISAGTLKLGSAPLFPVVYMSFDNVSGTNIINDGLGGAAMNGAVTGAGATIAAGKNGNGLSLSGDGSKVVINHRVTALDGSSPGVSWTLAMWIQTTTAGAGFAYQGAGAWAANNTDFFLINTNGPGSGGHVGAVRNSDGFMAGNVTVNDGNWHFIAITASSGLKSVYVDGVLDTTVPVANSLKNVSVGNQVWIGGTTNSATTDGVVNMTGLLDDVYIFERALTQPEIQTLMTVGGAGSVGTTLGAIPATPVITVENGATLDVSSLPNGLTLSAAQTLKGDGAFNVLGTLTNQGTIELKLNKTGVVLTNDSINNLSQITYGGTLKLDVSGGTLSTSDTFKLFSATTYAGAFTKLVPVFPSIGLAWDTSTLAADGTLRVAAGGPFTYPTNITAALANASTLELSWPADHQGWILQTSTNSLGIWPTNRWFSIPTSSATNQVFITINPANSAVFYRLISP
jgi:autotransporter-associated beta strand protein